MDVKEIQHRIKEPELTPEWADIRKIAEMARSTIVIEMSQNMDKKRAWKNQTALYHISCGEVLLEMIRFEYLAKKPFDKKHLERALCRLAMALTKMEEEKDGYSRNQI